VAAEERERAERQRRVEEERRKREVQEEIDRDEQRKKELEWAELRVKMEKQREKEAAVAAGPKKGPALSAEDQTAVEKLKMLRCNEFIDQKEYEGRLRQILARYPEGTRVSANPSEARGSNQPSPAKAKQQQQQPAAAVVVATPNKNNNEKTAPCPKCNKLVNVVKRFCPHCGFDIHNSSNAKKKAVPMRVPTERMAPEDAKVCHKLKQLLDEGLMEVSFVLCDFYFY
jgi:hypothetical protein